MQGPNLERTQDEVRLMRLTFSIVEDAYVELRRQIVLLSPNDEGEPSEKQGEGRTALLAAELVVSRVTGLLTTPQYLVGLRMRVSMQALSRLPCQADDTITCCSPHCLHSANGKHTLSFMDQQGMCVLTLKWDMFASNERALLSTIPFGLKFITSFFELHACC